MEFEHREAARAIRASYESTVSENKGEGLRILFLALTVDIGAFQGDSTHVVELVSNLRRLGYRVRWIARRSEGRDMWPDPFFHRVSRIPKPGSDALRLLQLLMSMVTGAYYIVRHSRACDVVYSRDRFSLLLALPVAKLLRKPIVYEVNGLTSEQRKMHGKNPFNLLYVWLLETLDKLAFLSAKRVVCVTDAITNFYSERHPKRARKFLTVNNGVSTAIFQPLPVNEEVADLKRRLGFDDEDEVVAYVGNLSIWQGIEYLVRSAPEVIKRIPGIRFMIVGRGPTYAQSLKLVQELGIGDRFKFVGQIPYSSLNHYVNVADVCVAPYTRDIPNCPIKIYEYLACGKPVICSDIPGIDNLRPTGALTLVEPCNPKALASALIRALGDMGARARQRELGPSVVSEYTWENTARKVAEVIEASVAEVKAG
jgi:glycosyltransferase involved in cell wall biosynthesis